MTTYFDYKNFVHDRPCIDGKPSSNNSKLYSAYSLKCCMYSFLTVEQIYEIKESFRLRVRLTYKDAPPLSRDEMLGLCYMQPQLIYQLIKDDWWMTNDKPVFNLFLFIKQLWLLIKNRKQRNYWWQNNLDQMKFITMKVPLVDRAFYYRFISKPVPLFYELIEWFDKKRKPSGRSSRAIRDLKYGLGNVGIYEYFDQGHPLKEFLRNKI